MREWPIWCPVPAGTGHGDVALPSRLACHCQLSPAASAGKQRETANFITQTDRRSAVVMLGKMLALEGGPNGVRTNVICPGDTWPRMRHMASAGEEADQYSPLITKKEPRITPASFDFWRANLKPAAASSSGTSMPSESLNPTARFFPSSMVYITLMDKPDS
jgi:NAD(P)-dependent dehydrogenase (short-subunit alcohol dehydrogenase family)